MFQLSSYITNLQEKWMMMRSYQKQIPWHMFALGTHCLLSMHCYFYYHTYLQNELMQLQCYNSENCV